MIEVKQSPQRSAMSVLADIESWPGWSEIGKVAAKEYGVSAEQYANVLPEYQKFMVLIALGHHLGMYSEAVDKLWHSHILHTQLYQEFCEQYVGRQIVHHLPNLTQEPLKMGFEICELPDTPPPEECIPPIPDTPPLGGGDEDEDEDDKDKTLSSSSAAFITAYHAVFGAYPPAIWGLASADGIAQ